MQASPNRSGIDFNKFEADFAKSREHRRIAQCNRTVGHTSVLSNVKVRAPSSSADSTLAGPSPPRENVLPTKEVQRNQVPTRLSSDSSSTPDENKNLGGARSHRCPLSGIHTTGRASNRAIPCRPHAAGGCRRPSPSERPHTALGLRRGTNHHDLFDARAADPGWGNGRPCPQTHRPPSAPERRRECAELFAVRRRRSQPSRLFSGDRGELPGGQRSRKSHATHRTGRRQVHVATPTDSTDDREKLPIDEISAETHNGEGEDASGAGRLCLGRTLLVEAKVLVGSKRRNNDRRVGGGGAEGQGGRGQTKVGLRFLSLDGLIRQRKGVQKTLRGFAVEASLFSPRRRSSSSSGASTAEDLGVAGAGDGSIGSTSVPVSAVQEYLEKTELGGAGDGLGSFREARPLDNRGNYQEITALLGKIGQRALYQILLGSCRVLTSREGGGKVGVQLLQVNAGAAGLSVATTPPSEARAHDQERDGRSRPANGMRDCAGRSPRSPGFREEVIGDSAVAAGASGGPSVVAEQASGKKKQSVVVRMPPAQGCPSASPKTSICEDEDESGDENEEDEGEENNSTSGDEDEDQSD